MIIYLSILIHTLLISQICGHLAVDFSSVRVIINLQTWVLLFDYLGIGVPTPPPSRSDTPIGTDGGYEGLSVPASDSRQLKNGSTLTSLTESQATAKGKMLDPILSQASVEKSLLEDAMDFCSLGSDENSMYVSAFQQQSTRGQSDAGRHETEGMFSAGSADFESLQSEVEDGQGPKATVWGVEGKISLDVAIRVKSLSVTFNKPEHPLAKGSVSSLSAQAVLKKGNVEISGSLGQASVVDLTQTGAYYRERCVEDEGVRG